MNLNTVILIAICLNYPLNGIVYGSGCLSNTGHYCFLRPAASKIRNEFVENRLKINHRVEDEANILIDIFAKYRTTKLSTATLDKYISLITNVRARDFDYRIYFEKTIALLRSENQIIRDFAYEGFVEAGKSLLLPKQDLGTVLGIAGEISGVYELAYKRNTSFKSIRIGEIKAFNTLVKMGDTQFVVKEFDAASENTVFEFKFHLSLKQLYEQVVGINSTRLSHFKILSLVDFSGIENLVYFGENDSKNTIRALLDYIEKKGLKGRVEVGSTNSVSVRLSISEFEGFMLDEKTLKYAGKKPVIDFLKSPEADTIRDILQLKASQIQEGHHFDVIIGVSNVSEKDLRRAKTITQTAKTASTGSMNGFMTSNEIHKRVGALLESLIAEHNHTAEHASDTMQNFEIIGAKEKFIGEVGKLLARIIITFKDGSSKEFVLKQENPYAMDEVASKSLKAMNLGTPSARVYGNNLFLIESVGQLNLSDISENQYKDSFFSRRLAYLAGGAAARSFAIGLSDRSGNNIRLVLDEYGLLENVINIDLTSAFTFKNADSSGVQMSIAENASILTHIINEAGKSGASAETLSIMSSLFLQGFETQLHELQNNYKNIDASFSNIDIEAYDKTDKRRYIMESVKSKKDIILQHLNPQKINIEDLKAMLLKSAVKNSLYFNSATKQELQNNEAIILSGA
jgi:hypothetical protein